MKCKKDDLKYLSDVLETIQLFNLEEVLILKIRSSMVAITFECRQCKDANTNFVSVFTASFSTYVWKILVKKTVKSLEHWHFPAIRSFSCLLNLKHYSYLVLK